MPMDLDTFLVALYTIVDDLYQQPVRAGEAGAPGPSADGLGQRSADVSPVCAVVGALGAGVSPLCAGALAGVFSALSEPECV